MKAGVDAPGYKLKSPPRGGLSDLRAALRVNNHMFWWKVILPSGSFTQVYQT